MKDRLVTLLLALAAFALCYVLIFPKPHTNAAASARPLSSEGGPSGYLGAWRWLAAEHVPVESLRERFEVLPLGHLPRASGNIMLTTLPHEVPVRNAEAAQAFPEKVTAFRKDMAVHGRFGQPCPTCGQPIQRIRYADNETNYCAQCQTDGKVLADRSLSRLLGKDWPRTLDELEALKKR